MLRILFALGATFGWCVSAPAALAALNPELDKPYHYQIVLRCARHPQLTEVFKERLQRELQDALRGALGDMAEVTITSKHPLLSEIEARGLQPALEGWKGEKDVKVQFILVDLVDETYRIQTGQYDSITGFASPVVRRAETDDREYVPRTVVRLIKPDFGLIGTVIDPKINPEKIAVGIKGSKLGTRLDVWVKRGDIFAVAQVRQAGAGQI